MDKDDKTTIQAYSSNIHWIKENVPGEYIRDKIDHLARFYEKHYNVPNWIAAGGDIAEFVDKFSTSVVEKLNIMDKK